ncbi:MAG: hypothetical protein HDR04_09675 [Lachnospiraceae bacterium]|nr:hypothetical protein [Lachnospiraceae bacterium]
MRIYLDMCCYNRPYDDQAQLKVAMETQSKLHIQMLVREKKLELIVSYMLRYECSKNPFEMRRNAIFDFIQENAAGYVGDDRKKVIEAKATEIMKTGIKFKDACHVASAIYAGCEYFISTDARLLKYNTQEIKMVTPIEFIMETEGDE